jgi:hypothetical protein
MNQLSFGSLLLVLAFAGCGGYAARNKTAMDESTSVLKIAVFSDGRLTVDGAPSSIQKLQESLRKLSEKHGAVWYYRESAQQEPPPIATEVLKEVIAARVPIRLSSKSGYSDSIGP